MKRMLYLLTAALLTAAIVGKAPEAAALSPTATPTPESTPVEPQVITIVAPVQEEANSPVPTAAPTPAPTAEPTPSPTPEPVTEEAMVRVDEAGAVGRVFALGEAVEVKAEQDGCYVIETEDGELLVESWRVRMDSETAPKSYAGFARNNIPVYEDSYLEGRKLATLGLNTQLTVEDAFGPLLRVTLSDGRTGYTLAANVSKTRIATGGGGKSSGGQDGGDIDLGVRFEEDLSIVRLGGALFAAPAFTPGTGTILAEGTEGYLRLFSRGDTVRVLERGDESCAVLTEAGQGLMATALLRFREEGEYEAWDGFASQKTVLHGHYRMLDEGKELALNTALRVVDQLPDRYVVEVNGQLGYLPLEQVSRTRIATGGGGGGSSGGEWTDPVL